MSIIKTESKVVAVMRAADTVVEVASNAISDAVEAITEAKNEIANRIGRIVHFIVYDPNARVYGSSSS